MSTRTIPLFCHSDPVLPTTKITLVNKKRLGSTIEKYYNSPTAASFRMLTEAIVLPIFLYSH